MRAVYYDRQGPADEVLIFGDVPRPVPGDGEVLVRVHVSGLNPTDVKARTGFSAAMPFPRIIPHQDGAGVIEAVGAGVPENRIGERVWLFEAQYGRAAGTAADFVAVPSRNAVALPAGVSFAVGASVGVPVLTAHFCLFADGDIRGRRVLVHGGAGAVGLAAIQVAKWGGAWVAATIRNPDHASIARTAGADLVLNLRSDDVEAEIKAATDAQGVDRIVDVALATNVDLNLACLATGGVISAYAMQTDATEKVAVPILRAMTRGAVFRFMLLYTVPWKAKEAAIADITKFLSAGAYKPVIGITVPLERAVEAHTALERRSVVGKVLLQVAEEDAAV